jgi:hypothetical protein
MFRDLNGRSRFDAGRRERPDLPGFVLAGREGKPLAVPAEGRLADAVFNIGDLARARGFYFFRKFSGEQSAISAHKHSINILTKSAMESRRVEADRGSVAQFIAPRGA